MNFKIYIYRCLLILVIVLFICPESFAGQITPHEYYVSSKGNDNNPGTKNAPFKTIEKVNAINIKAGDKVFFKARKVFIGTLKFKNLIIGSKSEPVIISSYGKGKAEIDGDSSAAISLYKSQYVTISNLYLKGAGRKSGNHQNGLSLTDCSHVKINNLEIEGFQKAGLLLYSSWKINIKGVTAHDNGYAGISVEADSGKKDTHHINIVNCRTENNPGDPTNLGNHSGNGIIIGHSSNVLIDHCTANNNGWDMPRVGNGPVGIWAYEADHVVIQHCLAYQNKTAKGADDGGGFDFDGGVTNSIIQYCVSYENQGSGYCLFQYAGASPWYNNIIRYNIGENDGTVSPSKAGIFVWNSSQDANQFYNCKVYGNIIYNSKAACISFANPNQNKGFQYYKNIFVAKDELIIGKDTLNTSEYSGNDWWSLKSGFNITGIKQLKTWANTSGKELKDGKLIGLNIFPKFKSPGHTTITTATQLGSYTNYTLPKQPELKRKLNLLQLKSN